MISLVRDWLMKVSNEIFDVIAFNLHDTGICDAEASEVINFLQYFYFFIFSRSSYIPLNKI